MTETKDRENHARTILLVEDEALIALAEAMTFERHGYRVIKATTGEQAVELAVNDLEIELVLMDINLGPGIDGTQAAQMVLAARELPIVFLSSHTEPEVVEKTEKITSYGYIVKNSGETVLTTSVKMAFRLFESRKLTDVTFRYSMNGLCIHRMLYNAAGEPFDCEYLKVNDAFEVHTGLSPQAVVGRTIRDIYPEDADEVIGIYSGVVSSGKPIRRELYFAPTNRWFELSIFPTRESEFTVVVQDVTAARKHTEQIIAAEKEWLNVTLQSVGDAVIATDVDGNVAVMNAVAEKLTGWKIDGAQGKPLSEVLRIVSSVTGRVCENPVARVIRDGEIVGLANHTMLISTDGSEYQIADSAAPIRDAHGVIIGVVMVFRDVSDEYRVAQALSDSEGDMARAQAMAKLGSWRLDLDSRTVVGSDEAREIYGVLDGDLTLDYVQSLAVAEYRPRLEAALQALIQDGTPYDVEYWMQRPSSDEERCIRSIAEYDADHRRVVGTIQDITEHKQMEVALRESELHFRTLANSGQALIWTSGVDKACNYFNEPWLAFTGRTLEQEWGIGWVEGVHPEDRDRCVEIYVAAFDRREPFSMIYRLKRADGQYRWIQDDGTARYDSHGKLLGYIGHCLDITDLKQAEANARNLQERLQKIIDNSPLLIHEVDPAGHYVMVNQATCALLDTTKEELLGKHFQDLLPLETASLFKERVDQIAETGEEMIVDDTLHINGQERLFRSALFPMQRDGESPPSIIGMAYEITTEKRLLAEKELLLKELNHRVKNNLAMVFSLINLKRLEMDIDLSDLQNQIRAIELIHQNLDQAKGVTEVFCREYFSDLLSSIFSSLSSRSVTVETDIHEVYIATSVAVPLGLIVNEIATNAIKHGFTDDGEARFLMKLKEDRVNDRCEVVLSNSGKPFPHDLGLDNPQTLGLRLVSALTKQLNATIDLERSPKPVFTIRFPTAVRADRQQEDKQHVDLSEAR